MNTEAKSSTIPRWMRRPHYKKLTREERESGLTREQLSEAYYAAGNKGFSGRIDDINAPWIPKKPVPPKVGDQLEFKLEFFND